MFQGSVHLFLTFGLSLLFAFMHDSFPTVAEIMTFVTYTNDVLAFLSTVSNLLDTITNHALSVFSATYSKSGAEDFKLASHSPNVPRTPRPPLYTIPVQFPCPRVPKRDLDTCCDLGSEKANMSQFLSRLTDIFGRAFPFLEHRKLLQRRSSEQFVL